MIVVVKQFIYLFIFGAKDTSVYNGLLVPSSTFLALSFPPQAMQVEFDSVSFVVTLVYISKVN